MSQERAWLGAACLPRRFALRRRQGGCLPAAPLRSVAQAGGLGAVAPSSQLLAPSAFSLIEVVIALGILSVGLVGAMRVFPLGLRASQRTEMSSRATMLAQRTIEALKLKSWNELADGETVVKEDPFETTTRIQSVEVDGLTDPTRMRSVIMTVRWQQDERSRALTFITYVRRN